MDEKLFVMVTDIEWDITEEDIEDYELSEEDIEALPESVSFYIDPEDIEDFDDDEVEEYIMDCLTDEYGWCIAGCNIKVGEKVEAN